MIDAEDETLDDPVVPEALWTDPDGLLDFQP
jgi:hypothetical protein